MSFAVVADDTGSVYAKNYMKRLSGSYQSCVSDLIAAAEKAENVVSTVMDITVSEKSQKDVSAVNDMVQSIADDAQQEQDLDALFADF